MAITRYTKKELVPYKKPSTALFIISECIIVGLISWIALSYGIIGEKAPAEVLSSQATRVEVTPTPSPSPQEYAIMKEISPTPVKKLPKDAYTIAVLGDSMVDTMGERLEYLEKALKEKYPATAFHLYNYGRGTQTVEEGLSRLGEEFHNKDRHYPILFKTNPDVVIIASFAYNPFTPYDRDRHWLGLTHLIQEVQKVAPEVYLLAEIAPLREDFGKGPQGVNWDTTTSYNHSQKIIEQLENAIGLSKTFNVPLIDAYTDSMEHGRVKKEYVDTADGIHPSVKGHEYIAEKIAETLFK